MTEKLLQFIWQFQYFNKQSLCTSQGIPLVIQHPGVLNTNQGPDFLQARIIIGDTAWAGTIELHLKSSDWIKHGHQEDDRYSRIILHVVWENDFALKDGMGLEVPALELQTRVSNMLLQQFDRWMVADQQVPCKTSMSSVSDLTWQHWKTRLLVERLMTKYSVVKQQLEQTNNHWEEVFWRMLCRYFGGSINGESFLQIAVSLPAQLLAKHKDQIHQLEALLLGQAGLLHKNFIESYPKLLYREYQFLQKKYGLRVVNLPPSFLRMRPINFPTVRLAQLASLVQRSHHLFSNIKEAKTISEIRPLLDATANDYWHYHYRFDEETSYLPKHTGAQLEDTIIINAVVPVLFSYAIHHADNFLKEKVLGWLELLKTENNKLIAVFRGLPVPIDSAFDSQAILHLKKEYCDAKRCLECAVGNAILKRTGIETTF